MTDEPTSTRLEALRALTASNPRALPATRLWHDLGRLAGRLAARLRAAYRALTQQEN